MRRFMRGVVGAGRRALVAMTVSGGIVGGMLGGASAQSDTAEFRPTDQAVTGGSRSDELANPKAGPAAGPATGRGVGAGRNGWGAADFAQQKESARAEIELWENRLRRKMADIDIALKGLDLKKIQGQKIAINMVDELLEEIDEEAKRIIDAKDRVVPDLKLYRQALLKAPDVFRKMADLLEQRAQTRKSAILKEASADMAAEARKLADTYEQRAKQIDGVEATIEAKLEFVVESREYISDVRELLSAIPTDHGLQTEKLVDQLNQYIEVFQEAVKTLQGVTQQIGEGKTGSPGASPGGASPGRTPRTPPAKPLSQAEPTKPEGPLTVADLRQRLAALKR